MRHSRRLALSALLSAAFVLPARADECDLGGQSAYKDIGFICKALSALGVADCNLSPSNSCKITKRPMFTGLEIEPYKPQAPKNWSGFGGAGGTYTAAEMCLLRDLQNGPVDSPTATTSLPGTGGDVSFTQRIQFGGWTHKGTELGLLAYNIGTLNAPAIGQITAFTQPVFLATRMQKETGQNAGDYAILNAFAIDVSGQSYNQSLTASLQAFKVVTPYGAVVVTPKFAVGRQLDIAPTPDAWPSAVTAYSNLGDIPVDALDVIDLQGGLALSQTMPSESDPKTVNMGWVSQVMLGARVSDPNGTLWSPTQAFSPRPDLDTGVPRIDFERQPNITASAAVNVAYSLTGILPDWITNNKYLTANLDVYAAPTITVGGGSQLGFWTQEGRRLDTSHWAASITQPPIPANYSTEHQFAVVSGTSASAGYELNAGFDFTIKLHVSFIKKTLIDIHPNTTIAKSVNTAPPPSTSYTSANFLSTSRSFQQTGALFERIRNVAHTQIGNQQAVEKYLKVCLAQPSGPGTPPPQPGYTPGDPSQLVTNLQMPCNMCIGMAGGTYTNPNPGPGEPAQVSVKGIPPQLVQPVSQANLPPWKQWACTMQSVGCYDMCNVSPDGSVFTVAKSAVELDLKDATTGQPLYCKGNVSVPGTKG